jgi:hypothetical protein
MQTMPISFESPPALWVGLALVLVTVGVAVYRRPALPRVTLGLAAAALVCLALAAGSPVWRGAAPPVEVMVDLSPSTRTATYREPGKLRERIAQLLGDTPYRITYFADGDAAAPGGAAPDEPLPDIPAGRTAFVPPVAAAVLLFSDARLELPAAAPPVHVVVDPALEQPDDAAVERLEARGGELIVTARNTGVDRTLNVAVGGGAVRSSTVPPGGTAVTGPLPQDARGRVAARLSPGDAWPENDALSLVPPPPAQAERWWVTRGPAAPGWRTIRPEELPLDPAAWLAPSVVVLDDVPADALDEARQQRLRQYAAELGGGVVILGGDAAFAAGAYAGTELDRLSPLAPHPPLPTTHWVLLVDSSGSMNAPAPGGGTRWSAAVDAVRRAVPSLPPTDPVTVGGFAGGVEWWVRGEAAGAVRTDALPPAGAHASGPTELRRALEAAAQSGGEAGPGVELIALTDANATVDEPAALASLMRGKKVRLHLLDIGDGAGQGLAALRQIVEGTGGTLLRQAEPAQWARAVRTLTRAATPDRLVRTPATVQFVGPLDGTAAREVAPPWNRTWPKSGATVVARGGEEGPLAASWQAGEGTAVAAGFGATPDDTEPLVRLAARPPHDPRLRVTWDAGEKLRVVVEALDRSAGAGAEYLNGHQLTLELSDLAGGSESAAPRTLAVNQSAPGRYEASIDAPAAPSLATLRQRGRAVERYAVAGHYPAEFERVGNDRRAMRELAGRTGGSVIEPSQQSPPNLPAPQRGADLTPWLAAAGAALLAAALVWWRAS